MILDRLKEGEDFTFQEKYLAEYIVDHVESVVTMGGEELADNAHVSFSTVSRLSKKTGAKNFADLKVKLAKEISSEIYEKRVIDANVPFKENDSSQKIVSNMASLCAGSIHINEENLDISALIRAASVIIEHRTVDFYGIGSSLAAADLFCYKLKRIGFNASIKTEGSEQFYSAVNSDRSHCAVFISYSGEMKHNLDIAKLLKERKVPIILITSNPKSSLAKMTPYVITIYANEEKDVRNKVDLFSSEFATLFAFNCLYSFIYSRNYMDNEIKRINRERIHYTFSDDCK